ncbi:MAG: hypothetical protein ACK6D4_15415, partial [Planctomyces sp.]
SLTNSTLALNTPLAPRGILPEIMTADPETLAPATSAARAFPFQHISKDFKEFRTRSYFIVD